MVMMYIYCSGFVTRSRNIKPNHPTPSKPRRYFDHWKLPIGYRGILKFGLIISTREIMTSGSTMDSGEYWFLQVLFPSMGAFLYFNL